MSDFQVVVIGTTNRCNARCTFCFRDKLTRPQGTMSDEVFHRIVDEYSSMRYNLCLFGDPLMDKKLPERIRYIKRDHPARFVFFHTNAGLLTPRLCDELVDSGLTFVVASVYGLHEQHDRLQPPTKFSRIVDNLDRLVARKLKVFIVFNRVEDMDAKAVSTFWIQRGCEIICAPGFDWGDGSVVTPDGPQAPGEQCLLTGNYAVFDWDGNMQTCCIDFNGVNSFGNAMLDTWQEARGRLRGARPPFCSGCKWAERFDLWRLS